MATTTNYSWSTPDDTALVKDGAAAIRSLGTAIDSTVFTNAGAAVTKATVDAKGDLIAGTADNTIARLAVGANDTVLTADSSTATGLKWGTIAAGSLTLLSTTSLTGTSVTISSISQSYKELYIIIRDVYLSSDDEALRLKLNADGSNHNYSRLGISGSSLATANERLGAYMEIGRSGSNSGISYQATVVCKIINYTSAGVKTITATYLGLNNAGVRSSGTTCGTYTGTSAVTQINLGTDGANFSSGSALIYGVN
jgi:hypothetical protein